MKRLASLALTVALLGLAACGGGGDDADAKKLRGEVGALRQELADATSSTTTTTVLEPTTATTTATTPPTTTAKPKAPSTPTTRAAPTTTTTVPPTTTSTTTYKSPQGTVTWALSQNRGPTPTANNCILLMYTVFNRSDSALKDVTFANVYNQETYKDSDGITKNRWGNPNVFPKQTVAAGIAPYGQGDVSVNWCPTSITPGTTSQFPVHIGEGRSGATLTTSVSWNWFATYPNSTNNFGSCCAWWDSNTKTGHQ